MSTDKYQVTIPTSKGDVVIESPEQWEEVEELGRYLGLLRRNRVAGSNRVNVSAIIANTEEDAKREVWSRNRTVEG